MSDRNVCIRCGKDCSFLSFCQGLCLPCGDAMQTLGKPALIEAMVKANLKTLEINDRWEKAVGHCLETAEQFAASQPPLPK